MAESDVDRAGESALDPGEAGEPDEEGEDGAPADERHKDSQKSYQTILEQEIAAGLHELERSTHGLTMSALSAGLDIGFSVLLIAVMRDLAGGVFSEPVVEMLSAMMYSVGFIFVIFGRSELFTEHTTLAFLPVLDGRASIAQLGRLWGIVYAANLVGNALFAALIAWIAPALGIVHREVFGEIAFRLTDHPWWVILLSALLAGWMMGLLSWLVTAGRDTISQVFFVWLVTSAIGFAHLHHSIVGAGEVLAAIFAGTGGLGLATFGHFLLWATLGNAVGGTVFVGLIKYAHAAGSQRGSRLDRES